MVTCLYAPSPFLTSTKAAVPIGHLYIRPEDAPGSADTVLETLMVLQLYMGPHDRLRDGSYILRREWLQ